MDTPAGTLAPSGDVFDQVAPEPTGTPAAKPGLLSNAWQDIKQSWQRTAGELAEAFTRPPTTSYAGVPPLPPSAGANNPPNLDTSAAKLASGRALPAFWAGQDLAQSAGTDYPLPAAYTQSFPHTLVSSATSAVPAVAASLVNPLAGATVGMGQMSEALRQTAIDAGHPEKADDAAAWGGALGLLAALPFGHILDGLKFGNPVIEQGVQALATGASEEALRPIVGNTLGKTLAIGTAKGAGVGAATGAGLTVGTNEMLRSTGINPNQPLTQGIVGNMAAGGILGLVGGAVASKLGYDAEQTGWESLARAYAEEVPSKPVVAAVQAYGQKRTPQNLSTVLFEANKTFADLGPEDQARVLQNLGIKLGVIAPTPAANPEPRNVTPPDPGSVNPATTAPIVPGVATTIFGSKGTQFPAQYAWAPTASIQTSHSGEMMAPNPQYALTNTRDYSDPAERDKQLDVLANFDPRRHVTDAPDASVGPSIVGTVIDENGQQSLQRFGGNNRGYAIANLDPFDRADLNQLQNQKAGQFGLTPTSDPDAELVRHIGTFDFRQPGERARAQAIVDALNPSPGMVQGTAKRAEIDAAQVPAEVLRNVPMDIAPKDAQAFVQQLIGSGFADRNLTSSIAASTAQAQDYVQRLLVNAAFQQPSIAEARSDPRSNATAVKGMIDAAVPALVQMRAQPGGAPIADAVSRAFTTTLGYLGKDGTGLPEALEQTARQSEIDPNHATAQQIAQAMRGALVTDKAGRIRAAETTANLQTLFGRIAGALAHHDPTPDIFGAQDTPHEVIARALAPAVQAIRTIGDPGESTSPPRIVGTYDAIRRNTKTLGPLEKGDWRELLAEYGDTSHETGRRLRWVYELADGRRMSAEGAIRATNPHLAEQLAAKGVNERSTKGRAAIFRALPSEIRDKTVGSVDYEAALRAVGNNPLRFGEWLRQQGNLLGDAFDSPEGRAAYHFFNSFRSQTAVSAGDVAKYGIELPPKYIGQGNRFAPAPAERFEPAAQGQALADNGGAPLASPGAPLPASRQLAMSMEGTGSVSIPHVLTSFENIMHALGSNVPIRIGRFFQRALGIYKPGPQVARIGNASNLATAAHEIAHALQHKTFGDYNSGVLNAKLPATATADLHRMGVALYGPKMPHNGYESEGWAELWRHYLTADDVATVAPAAWDYVTKTFLPGQTPAVQRAIQQAKALADLWRSQGAVNRAKAQMVKAPSAFQRMREAASGLFSAENWIEQFAPLKELADEYKAQTGKTLSPASNPYEVASARRGTSGAVALQMVMHGMVDLHGNLAKDASGRTIGSLREIVRPLRGLEDEFALYLWANRALELHARNQDPGMSLADAQHLATTLGAAHPEMGPVAAQLYEWQNAVLEYLAQASPAMRDSLDRMRAVNQAYIPLQRVMPKQGAASADARTVAGGSGALSRLRGSGRQVKSILDQIVANTQSLVLMAHKAQILQTIVQVAQAPGMGHLIEEVPRDRVRETVDIEAIRKQLEALGLDTSTIPAGETLDYYTLADRPKGSDNIVPVRNPTSGQTHWFQVSPELYDLLAGLQPPRLGPMGEWLAGKWARGFRLATTGVRPSFQLVTLPARQLPMLMLQTMSSDNPWRVFMEYMHGAGDAIRSGLLGQHTPYGDLFHQLAVEAGQPMGRDQAFTRQAVQSLFRGKVLNTARSPLEAFRSLINFMDRAPRIAEMRMVAERIGWAPGTPMTPDQAIAMANAGKRGGAVDYSAGGRLSQYFNQMIPFFNPAIQHVRTMARVGKERPVATLLRVFALAVLPALALWYKNKDEKWYQDLPWRERYLNDNFSPDGKNVVQIPRPQEWSIFPALAEGLVNAMFRKDPQSFNQSLTYSLSVNSPEIMPVLAKAAWEIRGNETSFFHRPIVPKSQQDLPPGDQFAPYTSELSRALGRAFPETISPRKIDAAVKGVFGGLGGDTLSASDALVRALGLGTPEAMQREKEAADFPVIGRLFRKGGVSTANNQTLSDFYDQWSRLQARSKSKVDPLTPVDTVYYMQLTATEHRIHLLEGVANATPELGARQRLYASMADMARATLAADPSKR